MGQCFLYGNGGNDRLKLRVFGGTSAPSSPQENDIWVKTSISIPSWEFSETAAPTWGMSKGYVYFASTYVAGFAQRENTGLNFLKKNAIFTNLIGCHQYDGSAWHNMDAYIYHSGWHQFSSTWDGELFENGNLYEDYTGGWPAKLGTLSETSPYLKYSAGSQNIVVSSGKMIDLTNYSQLHVIGRGRGDYTSSGSVLARVPDFGVAKTIGSTSVTYAAKVSMTSGYIGDLSTLTEEKVLDISSLSGEYYVAMTITGSHTGATLGVKKIWLT